MSNKFSVLLPVYFKDNPGFLEESLQSIFNQSLQPNEIVLVKDGRLTHELEVIIDRYRSRFVNLVMVQLENNVGLGKALAIGLGHCRHELVARMDSDDIAHKERFEKQINFLNSQPDMVAVGTQLSEFNHLPGDNNTLKKVPVHFKQLRKYAMMRNPLNHPSVVFRKSAIESVGSYQHMPMFEDYYLWLRLLKEGYKVENIDETLLYFRIGNAALTRRHGFQYIKSELNFYQRCAKEKLLPIYMVVFVLLVRLPLRLLPKQMFLRVYKTLLRK